MNGRRTDANGDRQLNVTSVADLERYPTAVRVRCAAIAEAIAAVDATEHGLGATRAERVRNHLAANHGIALSER